MAEADHRLTHLLGFLRELNRSRDLEALVRAVLEHAVSVVPGAQRGSLMLLNKETDCYEFRAAVGWPMEKLCSIRLPASQVLQHAVYRDCPAIIREPHRQDRAMLSDDLARALALSDPNRSILVFPIAHEGKVIAYLNLDNLEDPDAFSEEDLGFLALAEAEITFALQAVLQQARLAELERFFTLFFEQFADAVYIVAFDGTILDANAAACAQTGYTGEELIGMNIMHDLAHEQPVMTQERVMDHLRAGKLTRFEEVKRRKDGTLYTTECAVSSFTYRGRKVTLSINRDVTERREVEKSLEQRNRELEALLTASKALTVTLDRDQLLATIHAQVSALIPCDAFFIALWDQRKGSLTVELMVERGVSFGKRTIPADPKESLAAWIADTGAPLNVGDIETEPLPAGVQLVGEYPRAFLGVPLMMEGEAIGVMSVQSFTPRAFSTEQVRILTAFADLAAAFIRNAELHTGIATLQRKLLAVERKTRAMKLAESKNELYARLLDAAAEILGYSACGITEAEHGVLKVEMRRAAGPALGDRLALDGPGIMVAAWNAGQSVYVPDTNVDPRYVEGVPDTRSELAIPFRVGEQWVGVFDVQSPLEDGIPPEDRNLLEILTAHMAVALAGLERLEARQALSRKLERLHQAVDKMQQCSNAEDLCRTAVQTAAVVLGITECSIGLAAGEYLMPVASSSGVEKDARPMRRGEGVAGRTWELGQTLWGKLSDFPFARPTRADFTGVVSIPIGKEGVFQAVCTSAELFTETDVSLAEILIRHLQGELGRIRHEDSLRESEARFKTLFERLADAVFIVEFDGTIFEVNPAAVKQTGYTMEELLGRNIMDDLAADEPKVTYATIVEALKRGETVFFEEEKRRKDGTRYWTSCAVSPIELAGRLFVLSVNRDITDRKRAEEKLHYLSTHDALTGAHNRAYFDEELARLSRGRRFPVTVLMADVNGLKRVNDSLGHAAGDEVLRRAYRVLRAGVRGEDVVARIGGDEFGVVLPETDEGAASRVVARIREGLAGHNAQHPDEPLSMAFGTATVQPHEPLDAALRLADARMYEDKRGSYKKSQS